MIMENQILIYLLKANLALVILYFCYRILFCNDTFFHLRRIALLSILVIAFTYQIPDVSLWIPAENILQTTTSYINIIPQDIMVINQNKSHSTLDWWAITGIIYLIGVLSFLLRCLREIISIIYTYHHHKKMEFDGRIICTIPGSKSPHSFFKWIFLTPECHNQDTLKEILVHEEVHVRQGHSFDLILAELVCIICWFNPFARLLKKEIIINHEFIADQEVIYSGYNKKNYLYHLIGIEQPDKAIAKLTNRFSVLPLKKRIQMLNKKRTSRVSKVKYLTLYMVGTIMLFVNNISAMPRIIEEVTNSEHHPTKTISQNSMLEKKTGEPKLSAENKRYYAFRAPVIVTAKKKDISSEACVTAEDSIYYCSSKSTPEYPGGKIALMQYISKNMRYPENALKKNIEGRVLIQFVVDTEGNISNVKAMESVDPDLDNEAIRVVKSIQKKWKPAFNEGKPVKSLYMIPILFKIMSPS